MISKLLPALFLLLFTSALSAQTFEFTRPVANTIQVNGRYLFAEPYISGDTDLSHGGIDMDIVFDTVYAAHSGTISFASSLGNCGNYVAIDATLYDEKVMTLYCHLDKHLVSKGDIVEAGEPIGISGETGNVTGPHLHFEVQLGRHYEDSFKAPKRRKNPELFFALEGMGAIYGSVPGAPNSTRVNISPDPKPRPPYDTYSYSLTYNFADSGIGSHPSYGENYAIGDVKPGVYVITSINGYRREVTVEAGKISNADAETGTSNEPNEVVAGLKLNQNYPNPFNPTTTISFELSTPSFTNLSVYNMIGGKVAELVNEQKISGFHQVDFDAANLPSGVYIYRLQTNNQQITKKLTLVK